MKVKKYDKIQEELYSYEHDSGLKAYVIPKKGYNKIYATFATCYGSINNRFIIPGEKEETQVPDGIAHFLEHKLFEQEDGNVMDKFSALGSQPNAYTSFTQTVYLFSCTERFEDNFRLLIHYVQNPYLTDENVEKEKGIISQEIRMYEDNADWRVFFNLLDALYVNHPVKIDIAGTAPSISKITKETLYTCYNTFYHPSNMIILVAGDVDPQSVFRMVEEGIEEKKNPGEILRIFPDEPKAHHQQRVEQKLAVAMPQFQMGIKDLSFCGGYELLKRKITLEIILSILLGRSSPLYNELYDEGFINQSFGTDVSLEKHFGFTCWGGQSGEPMKVSDRIKQAIHEAKQKGLDKESFHRIRKAHEGRFIRSLNSPEHISHEFIPLYFKEADFFDYTKIYETLTIEDTEAVFRDHFSMEPVISIIWPLKE